MTARLIGYECCSTDRQDLAAQSQALLVLGVAEDRIYTDHGLTGTTRARPALGEAEQAALKGAGQELPEATGIGIANWNWKGVREFVALWFGISLSRSNYLTWLHRFGFSFKRPKKRLLKADEAKREAFVAEYAALGKSPNEPEPRYSSLAGPTSGPTPSCRASGC